MRQGLRYAPVCVLQELENRCWNLTRPSTSTLCHREAGNQDVNHVSQGLIVVVLCLNTWFIMVWLQTPKHHIFEHLPLGMCAWSETVFHAQFPAIVGKLYGTLEFLRFFWGQTMILILRQTSQTMIVSPNSPSIYHLDLEDVAWVELLDPEPSSSDSSASCPWFACRLQSLCHSVAKLLAKWDRLLLPT